MTLLASYLRAIESHVRPWTPVGLSNAIWDICCYDVTKLSMEELKAGLLSRSPMIEGAVIIVGPESGSSQVCDLRKYAMEKALAEIDTVVVPGCGTSAVGALAFGRTVAQAIGGKVAAIIAGYGVRDEPGEIGSGIAQSPLNWALHAFDQQVRLLFGRSIPVFLESRIFEVVAGIPEAATLHQILLHCPSGQIKTIVSHSKGNYAVAAALYALRCSLELTEAERKAIEGKIDIDKVIQEKTDIDVVTFGCWTRLPTNPDERFKFRYHQYVGLIDILGFLTSPKIHLLEMWLQGKIRTEGREYDEALVPRAMHNMVPWRVFPMPVKDILKYYAKQTSQPPLRVAA